MSLFRLIFRLLALILSVFLILPLVILLIAVSQKTNNRILNKQVLNCWSKLLCFVCGLKLVTKGIIFKNPVLIVANHVTWLDIPVIHSFKLVGFVAKKEISKWPILGWIVKSGETLFIERGESKSRKNVLELIQDRLNNERSIAVFPEGRVTDGSYVGTFHRQLMQAAIETNKPVQAIAIKYQYKQGNRNKDICFIDNEKFILNVIRILSLPNSRVELTFCDAIKTEGKRAREVANISHTQVAKVLKKNDYL